MTLLRLLCTRCIVVSFVGTTAVWWVAVSWTAVSHDTAVTMRMCTAGTAAAVHARNYTRGVFVSYLRSEYYECNTVLNAAFGSTDKRISTEVTGQSIPFGMTSRIIFWSRSQPIFVHKPLWMTLRLNQGSYTVSLPGLDDIPHERGVNQSGIHPR